MAYANRHFGVQNFRIFAVSQGVAPMENVKWNGLCIWPGSLLN